MDALLSESEEVEPTFKHTTPRKYTEFHLPAPAKEDIATSSNIGVTELTRQFIEMRLIVGDLTQSVAALCA